ncbi:hypothetical protein HanIR_Chr06g0269871 [Helianthus annuus]|nr:hypothetical protein HanIR_Chr06g0269871 [Helianthus annuus]
MDDIIKVNEDADEVNLEVVRVLNKASEEIFDRVDLYGPSMPAGCKIEKNEISCSSHGHEIRGQLLVNVQMFGLVFLVLVGVVGSYIFVDKRSWKSEFGVIHMKPLVLMDFMSSSYKGRRGGY